MLPEALRDEAAGSIGGTLRAVEAAKLGDQAPALIDKAVDTYLSGMQITMLVAAGVVLLAAAVSLRWLPKTAPKPPAPPTPQPAVGEGAGAPGARTFRIVHDHGTRQRAPTAQKPARESHTRVPAGTYPGGHPCVSCLRQVAIQTSERLGRCG
ncbi:hypothetical protein ACE14D_00625 [Streptomyces sp. Act-28]